MSLGMLPRLRPHLQGAGWSLGRATLGWRLRDPSSLRPAHPDCTTISANTIATTRVGRQVNLLTWQLHKATSNCELARNGRRPPSECDSAYELDSNVRGPWSPIARKAAATRLSHCIIRDLRYFSPFKMNVRGRRRPVQQRASLPNPRRQARASSNSGYQKPTRDPAPRAPDAR